MVRHLLSAEDEAAGDAAVLFRAATHGRDQQHVLSFSTAQRARGMGARGAARVPFLHQADAAQQPHRTAEAGVGRGFDRLSLHQPRVARRQTRSGSVPASADDEEGSRAARRLPRAAAAGPSRRLRIPQRLVVLGRRLCGVERRRRIALLLRTRGQRAAAAGGDRAVGLRAASAGAVLRRRSRAVGAAPRIDRVEGDLRLLHARAHRARVRPCADAARREMNVLLENPANAWACYVMAHGAGAGMKHPFMEVVASGLAARGIATLRYEFPYMERGSKRPDTPAVAKTRVREAIAEAARRAPPMPSFPAGKPLA